MPSDCAKRFQYVIWEIAHMLVPNCWDLHVRYKLDFCDNSIACIVLKLPLCGHVDDHADAVHFGNDLASKASDAAVDFPHSSRRRGHIDCCR